MRALRLFASALFTCFTGGCSWMVYMPSRRVLGRPQERPEDVWMRAADGTRLHGWLLRAQGGKARGTFVQFHGNAGNMSGHFRYLAWVVRRGYNLFTFDYRGYGASAGTPDQAGVNQDAVAAIHKVQQLVRAPGSEPDLVLYGQSLGGAVLLRALDDIHDRRRIRAVIVEGTFASYQQIAASVLWRTPVLLPFTGLAYSLVSDEYAPDRSIARVSPIPLLVIHDVHDPVVPFRFGLAVYELAREPKELWPVDYGTHLGATRDPALQRLLVRWVQRAGCAPRGQEKTGTARRGSRFSCAP